MKNIAKLATYKMIVLLIIFTFMQTIIWAQDNTQSSSTTTTSTHVQTSGGGGNAWYTSPWVWIAAGAVFILLLLALTRGGRSAGNSSTDKVTVTKTVSKNTDTDVV